jgi:hypothetical protein
MIPASSHELNTERTVAVDRAVFWQPMSTCPRGVKCQLLGKGKVATYSEYHGSTFWIGWCPLPSIPEWMK